MIMQLINNDIYIYINQKSCRSLRVCVGHVHIVEDLKEVSPTKFRTNRSPRVTREATPKLSALPQILSSQNLLFLSLLRTAKTLGTENVRCRDDVCCKGKRKRRKGERERERTKEGTTKTMEVSLNSGLRKKAVL